jgi:hypothetical protein
MPQVSHDSVTKKIYTQSNQVSIRQLVQEKITITHLRRFRHWWVRSRLTQTVQHAIVVERAAGRFDVAGQAKME